MDRSEVFDSLTQFFRAGVAAADPYQVTRESVAAIEDLTDGVWIIAVGKGAHAMAAGAVDTLSERHVQVAGGLVIAQSDDEARRHGLPSRTGDHPVPREHSLAAAAELGRLVAAIPSSDDAIILVSGGATSLMAGPVEGLPDEDLRELFNRLLGSGADIDLMNAVRKRVLRWGAGRLATSLRARHVHCLIASDVIGNRLESIASGPCVPDPLTARDVLARVATSGLLPSIPATIRTYLNDVSAGRGDETPKAGHPRFATTSTRIILDRQHAVRGAAEAIRAAGLTPLVQNAPLTGEACAAGQFVVGEAFGLPPEERSSGAACLVFSGETTVRLGANPGRGGRCQELALAAARALDQRDEDDPGVTVLAAGTDGRDGPTDAAGAIVDGSTWGDIEHAGLRPDEALAGHDAWSVLDATDSLLRTGPTGTNVNDLVLVYVPEG